MYLFLVLEVNTYKSGTVNILSKHTYLNQALNYIRYKLYVVGYGGAKKYIQRNNIIVTRVTEYDYDTILACCREGILINSGLATVIFDLVGESFTPGPNETVNDSPIYSLCKDSLGYQILIKFETGECTLLRTKNYGSELNDYGDFVPIYYIPSHPTDPDDGGTDDLLF